MGGQKKGANSAEATKSTECSFSHSEIMDTLNGITKELKDLKSQGEKDGCNISELLERMNRMEKLLQEKDKKIEALERRIDDLEQYSRKEDVIVSGLTIKKKSYADTTRNGTVEEETEVIADTEDQT